MLIKTTRRERKNERKAYSCKIKSCCCSVDKLITKFKWTSLDSEESGSRTSRYQEGQNEGGRRGGI